MEIGDHVNDFLVQRITPLSVLIFLANFLEDNEGADFVGDILGGCEPMSQDLGELSPILVVLAGAKFKYRIFQYAAYDLARVHEDRHDDAAERDVGLGYLISRPVSEDEVLELDG